MRGADGRFRWDPRSDVERFWSYTKKGPGGCVDWTGSGSRYGKFSTRDRKTKKQTHHLAHRWIYERCLGPVGDLLVMHSCDRPRCVSLQHLSPGTQKQNIADAIAKGRRLRLQGARHHKARLTAREVREIRRRASKGETHKSLAIEFGVTRPTITAAVAGRNWGHIK